VDNLSSSNDGVGLNLPRRQKPDVSGETQRIRLRKNLRIGTWNVRSLKGTGKINLLDKELERYNFDIVGLAEVRWSGEGFFNTEDDSKVYYCGGKGAQRGVAILLRGDAKNSVIGYHAVNDRIIVVRLSGKPFNITLIQVYAPTSTHDDNEIEAFYDVLQDTMKLAKSQDILIVMGDLNAKIGDGREPSGLVGPHGLGTRNERGDRLVQFCDENDMIVCNTFFQHHPRRKYTWTSPGNQYRNQIDYVLIKQRWKTNVTNCRTFPGADIDSDHNLLYADFKLHLKKLKKASTITKYDIESLQNLETKEKYKVAVSNAFQLLTSTENTPQELWT
jgi:exonuclease III